jgi:hypothetical protein
MRVPSRWGWGLVLSSVVLAISFPDVRRAFAEAPESVCQIQTKLLTKQFYDDRMQNDPNMPAAVKALASINNFLAHVSQHSRDLITVRASKLSSTWNSYSANVLMAQASDPALIESLQEDLKNSHPPYTPNAAQGDNNSFVGVDKTTYCYNDDPFNDPHWKKQDENTCVDHQGFYLIHKKVTKPTSVAYTSGYTIEVTNNPSYAPTFGHYTGMDEEDPPEDDKNYMDNPSKAPSLLVQIFKRQEENAIHFSQPFFCEGALSNPPEALWHIQEPSPDIQLGVKGGQHQGDCEQGKMHDDGVEKATYRLPLDVIAKGQPLKLEDTTLSSFTTKNINDYISQHTGGACRASGTSSGVAEQAVSNGQVKTVNTTEPSDAAASGAPHVGRLDSGGGGGNSPRN